MIFYKNDTLQKMTQHKLKVDDDNQTIKQVKVSKIYLTIMLLLPTMKLISISILEFQKTRKKKEYQLDIQNKIMLASLRSKRNLRLCNSNEQAMTLEISPERKTSQRASIRSSKKSFCYFKAYPCC
jgi:hypothetical protein